MKTLAFAIRNAKEMLRDKLNLVFGIGFPVIVLLLLSLIQSNIPVDLFNRAVGAWNRGIWFIFYFPLFWNVDCKGSHRRLHATIVYLTDDRSPFYSWLYGSACATGRCTDGGMLRSGPLTGVNMQCADFACNGCIDSCRAAFYWDWSALWERIQ